MLIDVQSTKQKNTIEAMTMQPQGSLPEMAELKRLSPLNVVGHCGRSDTFAFTICGSGTATIVSRPGAPIVYSVAGELVPDATVKYQLWKTYVRKQHGLSLRAEKCDAFSDTERALVAGSMRRFFPPGLTNLERLLRFEYLYRILLTQSVKDFLRNLRLGKWRVVSYKHGIVTLVNKVKINESSPDESDQNYTRTVEMRSIVDLARRQFLKTQASDETDQKLVLHRLSLQWIANRTDYGSGGLTFTEGGFTFTGTRAVPKRHTVIWMGHANGTNQWKVAQVVGDFVITSFNVDPRFPNFAYICAYAENRRRIVYEYNAELNALTRIDFPEIGDRRFFYTKLYHGEYVKSEYDAEFAITNHTTGLTHKMPVQVYDSERIDFSCLVMPSVRTLYSPDQAARYDTTLVILSFPVATVNIIELPGPQARPAQLALKSYTFPRRLSQSQVANYTTELKIAKNSIAIAALVQFTKGSESLETYPEQSTVSAKSLIYVSLDYGRMLLTAIPNLTGFQDEQLVFPNYPEWHSTADLQLSGIVHKFFPKPVQFVVTQTS